MTVLKKYDDVPEKINLLSQKVVDSIFRVHQYLGPGYLESIYEDCLCLDLAEKGISFARQFPVQLDYRGKAIPSEFKLDLVVDNAILVELKAVDKFPPVHEAQIYSYLKMTGLTLGFLVNFNVPLIKDGIKRYVPKNLRSFGSSRSNSSSEVA